MIRMSRATRSDSAGLRRSPLCSRRSRDRHRADRWRRCRWPFVVVVLDKRLRVKLTRRQNNVETGQRPRAGWHLFPTSAGHDLFQHADGCAVIVENDLDVVRWRTIARLGEEPPWPLGRPAEAARRGEAEPGQELADYAQLLLEPAFRMHVMDRAHIRARIADIEVGQRPEIGLIV